MVLVKERLSLNTGLLIEEAKELLALLIPKEMEMFASTLVVDEKDQIILSTDKGRVIRCSVNEIRIAGRNTQGVRIIKLSGEEKVVSAIKIDNNIELMFKTAIYPGTFDPITLGHIDIIKKSLKFVDRLIVATTDNPSKDYLFDSRERVEIIKKSLFSDMKNPKK